MSRILNTLRNNKGLALILGAFLLLIVVFILDSIQLAQQRQSSTQNPIKTVDSTPPAPSVKRFSLKSVKPESGVVHELDSFQPIEFYFSVPVNVDTADIAIAPRKDFSVRGSEADPTKLVLIPRESWDPRVRYIILIRALSGQNDEILEGSIRHIYENVPPDTTKMKFPY